MNTHPAERETPAGEAMREAVKTEIRKHIRVDASGLAPAIAHFYIDGFDAAADAVLAGPIASELARLTAERDEARARADKAEREARDLHQQNEKLTSGCPWEGPASEAAKYQPSDPCPICGDTGEVSNDQPSRCVAYASGRQNYALAAAEAALTTQRADHAAEMARLKGAAALALEELDWQVEQAEHCGDPNYECPMQDIHAPGDGHLLARNALRAALAPKETTDA